MGYRPCQMHDTTNVLNTCWQTYTDIIVLQITYQNLSCCFKPYVQKLEKYNSYWQWNYFFIKILESYHSKFKWSNVTMNFNLNNFWLLKGPYIYDAFSTILQSLSKTL